MQRQSWEQGMMAQMYMETGDENMLRLTIRGLMIHRTKEGLLGAFGGSPIDALACAEAVWHTAQSTREPELLEAAERMLNHVLTTFPRAPDGTLYSWEEFVMCDHANYAPPFLAASGHYEEALAQIEGYRRRLWNPSKQLYSNIWDDRTQDFKRRDFWGVGNGWVASALMRILRALPENRSADREKLTGYLRDLLDGCLAYQRPDGAFHNVIDDPNSFLEVNLGQMLAYVIFESVRGGWLPDSYLPAAERMRAAAWKHLDRDGIVQSVAGAPDFNHSGFAPEAQVFFVLMEHAAGRLGERRPPAA